MEGWIKLHRHLAEKAFYKKDSEFVHLWVHILITANHTKTEEYLGGELISCDAGQFTTGRKQLSQQTGICESKIERILNKLEKIEQQIEQQKTSTNRLITVVNWNKYQSGEQQTEQRVNNDRTTSEQRVNNEWTHLKNDKNGKNIKNDKKEEEKKEKKESLIFPFSGSEFLKNWQDWITQPQNKKKSESAKQKTLNRLGKYPEKFANVLLDSAISGEYQGCVFPDTPKKYNDWKKIDPETGAQFSKNMSFTDFQNLGKNGTEAGF